MNAIFLRKMTIVKVSITHVSVPFIHLIIFNFILVLVAIDLRIKVIIL